MPYCTGHNPGIMQEVNTKELPVTTHPMNFSSPFCSKPLEVAYEDHINGLPYSVAPGQAPSIGKILKRRWRGPILECFIPQLPSLRTGCILT